MTYRVRHTVDEGPGEACVSIGSARLVEISRWRDLALREELTGRIFALENDGCIRLSSLIALGRWFSQKLMRTPPLYSLAEHHVFGKRSHD
jgi:hypothetical protein